jgi:hypothetical protein
MHYLFVMHVLGRVSHYTLFPTLSNRVVTILMHKPQDGPKMAQDGLKMAPTQPMTVLYDRTNRSLNNFRERPLVPPQAFSIIP